MPSGDTPANLEAAALAVPSLDDSLNKFLGENGKFDLAIYEAPPLKSFKNCGGGNTRKLAVSILAGPKPGKGKRRSRGVVKQARETAREMEFNGTLVAFVKRAMKTGQVL